MSILRAENSPGLERRRPASPWDRGRIVHDGLATLLVGAGAAARTVARDLRRSPDYGLQSHRLLDDDPRIRSVSGIPMLGRPRGPAPRRRRTQRSRRSSSRSLRFRPAKLSALVRAAADTGAHVRYLPSFLSALERAARAADMRT